MLRNWFGVILFCFDDVYGREVILLIMCGLWEFRVVLLVIDGWLVFGFTLLVMSGCYILGGGCRWGDLGKLGFVLFVIGLRFDVNLRIIG